MTISASRKIPKVGSLLRWWEPEQHESFAVVIEVVSEVELVVAPQLHPQRRVSFVMPFGSWPLVDEENEGEPSKATEVASNQDAAFARIEPLLKATMEFEGKILGAGLATRERAKRSLPEGQTDARMCFMAALAHLMTFKSGVPGESNESRSDRISLLAVFVQGTHATETLIMEGQYAKAAAALKQDLEIVARFAEVREGKAVDGRNPNIKNAPEGSGRMYGALNDVAHPADEARQAVLLGSFEQGAAKGVSPFPTHKADAVVGLYDMHLFTLHAVVKEAIFLFGELYPGDVGVAPALELYLLGTHHAVKSGALVMAETAKK